MMHEVLKYIGLKRRQSITIPENFDEVKVNLFNALQEDIILDGKWQLTRRYWGHMKQNNLTLYGPRAHRQFCFLTCGHLRQSNRSDETFIDLEITLAQDSETQLLVLIGAVIVILPVVLRWFGLFLMPVFIAFYYGMTQWHFEHYKTEISQLLHGIAIQPHQ